VLPEERVVLNLLVFTRDSPFFSHQEQETKSRVKGIEALKASITAAKSVARTLRSSLGPKGMDKMLQSSDGDITISEYLSISIHL
jgi:hypothetical protein